MSRISFSTAFGSNVAAEDPACFVKMHGLGNDFVIMDRRSGDLAAESAMTPAMTPAAARAIGDRRTGVGFDQLIVLSASDDPACAVRMTIWNPDGGLSGACGNATRCVASLIMAETGADSVAIRTDAGVLACAGLPDGRVRVNMGPPGLDWRDIPLAQKTPTDAVNPALLPESARDLGAPGAVGMGNPHVVFFVADADAAPVATLGPVVETAPLFPERTNVEFCSVVAPGVLRMRVWERGAGVTRACGSGACAAVVAAARQGVLTRGDRSDDDVYAATVRLDGGDLDIAWAPDGVWMTGPVAFCYAGVLSPDFLMLD